MRPVVPFRRWCRQVSMVWILISVPILLGAHVSGRNFGYVGKQDSLKSMRERAGIQLSTRARDGRQTHLSHSGKLLLSKIAEAGNRTDWNTVQRLFSSYNGTETQIFNAVLHHAARCSQCKVGARIYERVCQLNVTKNSLTFTAAIAIHSDLNHPHVVRQIWTEALQSCSLDEPLAQARIAAAAAEGDVYTAAEGLDTMNRKRVQINNAHITSAIRACWEAKSNDQNAAEHLFNLSFDMGLQPEIPMYTCLMGAYRNAALTRILKTYDRMKDSGVRPNRAFAEVFLIAVLRVTKNKQVRNVKRAPSCAASSRAASRQADSCKRSLG